jgi:hypothetical protein
MAERTCCKTCQKKQVCETSCGILMSGDYHLCGWCKPCPKYVGILYPASSKPRILAV